MIVKPLNRLLRKSVKFKFDEECIEAFNKLKELLTSYPILQLYNLLLETQLHIDASAIAVARILLQKQKNGHWAPVVYYNQSTNEAEAKYHTSLKCSL